MEDIFSQVLTLTSFITRQLIQFIEDLVLRDLNRSLEEWSIIYNSQHPSSCSNQNSDSMSCSSSTHCNSSASLGIREGRASDLEHQSLVNSRLEIIHRRYNYVGVPFIFKCIISRVCKTLHGSSDEIGWLQRAPGMPSVEDGSIRFRNCYKTLGLFSNHGPLYFLSTKRFFSKMGLACHIAKIHSEASVEHNAWELKQYIEELYWGSGKRVMLLGHSKGGVDAAAALSIYSHELKDKVGGLALVQSPYGGTPIVSDILREGQLADKETHKIMEFVICKLIKGDILSLEDLTYEKRKGFILKNKLPDNIPLISFHSEANITLGVIATMSHIAHAELAWLSFPRFGNDDAENAILVERKVPVVVPVSAALALCAFHLQLRYREKSDGLVTCRDAEVPGSVVVKPDRKLDHAWMVYSSWKRDPSEPDAPEMCEALLTMLVELGSLSQKSKQSINSV